MVKVDKRRINDIKTGNIGSGPIMYIMARDQRIDNNWALLFAQELAIQHRQPMVVACPIALDYPDAPLRQIHFIFEGLYQVGERLRNLGIPFIVTQKSAYAAIFALIENLKISALVTDFSPLKESRQWKNRLTQKTSIPFFEVDAHNIIPCWEVSNKQEYAAYTIRPKINRKINDYLVPFPDLIKHPYPKGMSDIDIPKGWETTENLANKYGTYISYSLFEPGESAAQKVLKYFLYEKLLTYNNNRNDPSQNAQSNLSPYLHFGQISAQQIALETQSYDTDIASQESFLEELIIRRELSDNYCYHNKNYNSLNGFPSWAHITLNEHRNDPRPHLYDRDILESADTHDELWNASQSEMILTGKMHGYMRMYWAKKILEWSVSPEEALANAIYLNNKYELDGHDPNGYSGIAWSIGGVHDRAWSEREIFGKIRYMNYNGCQRKFSIADYVNRTAVLKSELIA